MNMRDNVGFYRSWTNSPIMRARTKAHTGNCVFQTSMEMTPNTNIVTRTVIVEENNTAADREATHGR